MNELHLFAGAGGGILGGHLLGHRTVCAVEIESFPKEVLLQRQRDGVLPWFPIWDDIRTFDGTPWRDCVDIVCGGFPCQDISAAGKGKGISGERSGLWAEMARVVSEVRPKYVFVENSPLLTGRGLDRVLMDLASMGYDAKWGVLGADDAGAPHRRKRIWIFAYDPNPDMFRYQNSQHEKLSNFREYHAQCNTSETSGERALEDMAYSNEYRCNCRGSIEPEHNADQVEIGAIKEGFEQRDCRKYWSGENGCTMADSGCQYGDERVGEGLETDPSQRAPISVHDQSGSERCGEPVADPNGKRGCSRNPGWEDAMDADPSSEEWMQVTEGISWWEIDPAELPDPDNFRLFQCRTSARQGAKTSEDGSPPKGNRKSNCCSSKPDEWPVKSGLVGVADGMADWVDLAGAAFGGKIPRVGTGIDKRVKRLKAIGNGQVPVVAAMAFIILSQGIIPDEESATMEKVC